MYKAIGYKKGGFKISGPCKAAAKSKFDVYPSAYANAWGVRCTKAGGPGSMGKSKKQFGGESGIDFRTKDEIKADKKAEKKTARKNRRDERRVDRKIKRYTGKAIRKSDRKNPEAGAAQRGLNMYQDKLQDKAKRKRKRKARRQKVGDFGRKLAAGVKARTAARRNRRSLNNSKSGAGSGNCSEGGCGAYKYLGGYR